MRRYAYGINLSLDDIQNVLNKKKTRCIIPVRGVFEKYDEGWSLNGNPPRTTREDWFPYGCRLSRVWVKEKYIDEVMRTKNVVCAGNVWTTRYELDFMKMQVKPKFMKPDIKRARIFLKVTTEPELVMLKDVTVEHIVQCGFKTFLREHDACCDLREQWKKYWKERGVSMNRLAWNFRVKLIEKKRT